MENKETNTLMKVKEETWIEIAIFNANALINEKQINHNLNLYNFIILILIMRIY